MLYVDYISIFKVIGNSKQITSLEEDLTISGILSNNYYNIPILTTFFLNK